MKKNKIMRKLKNLSSGKTQNSNFKEKERKNQTDKTQKLKL